MSKLVDAVPELLAVLIGLAMCLAGVWLSSRSGTLGVAAAGAGLVLGLATWWMPPEAAWARYGAVALLVATVVALPALGRAGWAFALEWIGTYVVLSRGGERTPPTKGGQRALDRSLRGASPPTRANTPMIPQPPLFFWEPSDLTAFASVEEAEAYLEPPDVQSGDIGRGYDSLGRELRVWVETQERRSLFGPGKTESVKVGLTDDQTKHPEKLKEIFVAFLEACAVERPVLDAADDQEIMAMAFRYGAIRS